MLTILTHLTLLALQPPHTITTHHYTHKYHTKPHNTQHNPLLLAAATTTTTTTRGHKTTPAIRMGIASDKEPSLGALYDGWGAEGVDTLNKSHALMQSAYKNGVDRYKLAIAIARHAKQREYANDHSNNPAAPPPRADHRLARRPKESPIVQTVNELSSILDEKGELPNNFLHYDPDDDDDFFAASDDEVSDFADFAPAFVAPPPPPPPAVTTSAAQSAAAVASADSDAAFDGDGGGAKLEALNRELLQAEPMDPLELAQPSSAAPPPAPLSEDEALLESILAGLPELDDSLDEDTFDDESVTAAAAAYGEQVLDGAGATGGAPLPPLDDGGEVPSLSSLLGGVSLDGVESQSYDSGRGLHPGDS